MDPVWCSVTGCEGSGLGRRVCGGLGCGLGRSGGGRWATQRHPLGRSGGIVVAWGDLRSGLPGAGGGKTSSRRSAPIRGSKVERGLGVEQG